MPQPERTIDRVGEACVFMRPSREAMLEQARRHHDRIVVLDDRSRMRRCFEEAMTAIKAKCGSLFNG